MDDPAPVRVLHGVADRGEQFEPLADGQPLGVAERGDGDAREVLHGEERPPRLGRARVVDPRDRGMVHEREGLALALEAGDHESRVHSRPDQLERDLPADRPLLFGEVHDAEATLPEQPLDAVGTDVRPRPGCIARGAWLPGREERAHAGCAAQQRVHARPERRPTRERAVEERTPLGFGLLQKFSVEIAQEPPVFGAQGVWLGRLVGFGHGGWAGSLPEERANAAVEA